MACILHNSTRMHFATHELTHILNLYGYWAVLVFVMVESTGIPVPGETILLTAAIYAGHSGNLFIGWVIAAAAAGAIVGDNIGYTVGREGGFRLLRRYGKYIRLDEKKIKVGQYLFLKHGGKVVFFGRFVAVLRAWAAFLAGVNRMRWPLFLLANTSGAILWAGAYGMLGWALGDAAQAFESKAAIFLGVIGLALAAFAIVFTIKNEKRLEEKAEKALPGPLKKHPHLKQAA